MVATHFRAVPLSVVLAVLLHSGSVLASEPTGPSHADRLATVRLIGKANYENGKFKEAADEFRRCIELAPNSAVDHFNLSIVLVRSNRFDEALLTLTRAAELDADMLGVHYMLGIVYKRQGKFEEAVGSLRRVVERDAECTGAFYNLGVCHKYLAQHEEAIAAFQRAVELAPTHPSAHYQLMTLYRRIGDVERSTRHREFFDKVKDTVDPSEKTVEALERSEYTDLIIPRSVEGERPPRKFRGRIFVEVSEEAGLKVESSVAAPMPSLPATLERAGYDAAEARSRYGPSLGGAVTLADYDGDGDLDICLVNAGATPDAVRNRLFRNDGTGLFADVTGRAGVGDEGLGMDAVFGDYDSDGDNDLYVVNAGPNTLYRNNGDGTFENVSRDARADEPQFGRTALFVDYDHDHDLDIFVGNQIDLNNPPAGEHFTFPNDMPGELNALLRNDGNGTFTDRTDEAGLLVDFSQTEDVLFADFDGDHDTDLFVVSADSPPRLFSNVRFGKFVQGGSFEPSLDGITGPVAEGDFNHDGLPDLLLVIRGKLWRYTNNGRAHFSGTPATPPGLPSPFTPQCLRVADFNNDGFLDVLFVDVTGRRIGLLAGAAAERFDDVTVTVGLNREWGNIADVAAGDLDGDGDQDIVLHTRDRGPVLLRNDSAERASWIRVHLVGKKVNTNGYGAAIEVAAAGHYQRKTVRSGATHFGLGDLRSLDVVRVMWPNGVAQNVIRPELNSVLTITEEVKVSASCGFLYAFSGKRFELINEILGVGPLGVPMAPGVYHKPDSTELTKIESNQLVPRDGFYELRLTEELRETMYADQFTLRVVDHPSGLEIVPNEMFTAPPFPEDKLHAVAERIPPRSAYDDRGRDVLPLLMDRDGLYPTFPLTSYDGLAEPHTLTLDLGDIPSTGTITLFLDGWIYWPDSSTVMAIAQDPRFDLAPLSLELRDAQGEWQVAIESVGLPTSKGLVVPVDLSGQFTTADRHIRLSTNLCVYFDRVFVSTTDFADRCRVTELPVISADLHYRGFSRMTRSEHGYELFDYDKVSTTGSWSPPAGFLTRYGEVTSLLTDVDDMLVIFGPGDELTLRFDAHTLPDLPSGWIRDFVFYANGWVKDGDLNTKFSETVMPLPFHGMSGYPYPPSEHYPKTPELERYRRTYLTRPSISVTGTGRADAGI